MILTRKSRGHFRATRKSIFATWTCRGRYYQPVSGEKCQEPCGRMISAPCKFCAFTNISISYLLISTYPHLSSIISLSYHLSSYHVSLLPCPTYIQPINPILINTHSFDGSLSSAPDKLKAPIYPPVTHRKSGKPARYSQAAAGLISVQPPYEGF